MFDRFARLSTITYCFAMFVRELLGLSFAVTFLLFDGRTAGLITKRSLHVHWTFGVVGIALESNSPMCFGCFGEKVVFEVAIDF